MLQGSSLRCSHSAGPRPRGVTLQCRAAPSQVLRNEIKTIKAELFQLLDSLERNHGPAAAILPGNQQEKMAIDNLLDKLQKDDYCFHLRYDDPSFRSSNLPVASSSSSSSSPSVVDDNLLGPWRLVYASKGTAVTRTGLTQLLVAASRQLPGLGLFDVSQELSTDPGGAVRSCNTAVFGLGPLGNWNVGIEGSWRNTGDGRTAWVAFDSFKIRPVNWMGVALPAWLPKLELGTGASSVDMRSGAEWVTSFCDEELRVGKGKTSGNLFLFRKMPKK